MATHKNCWATDEEIFKDWSLGLETDLDQHAYEEWSLIL